MATPIEGELVTLRALEPEDVELLNPQFNDPDVLVNLVAVPFPQPKENFEEFRAAQAEDPTKVNFTIVEKATGHPVGVCGLEGIALHTSPEVGIWVGKTHWDKGFGTDAVRAVCRYAFGELNAHRVTLTVLASNERAQRAYEKVGFVREGTMRQDVFTGGDWQDVQVMGLLTEDLED